MLGLLHCELYTMLWKHPYNWLGSMVAINSCPSIKWFKWPRKRPYISCCPLWDQHCTPLLPQNLIDPSFHFPIESNAADAPYALLPPAALPESHSENFLRAPIFQHPEQNCSETKKLLYNPFSPLVYVKPSLNVTTVFACQWVSVCSSLFSDVDSLIACELSSLC